MRPSSAPCRSGTSSRRSAPPAPRAGRGNRRRSPLRSPHQQGWGFAEVLRRARQHPLKHGDPLPGPVGEAALPAIRPRRAPPRLAQDLVVEAADPERRRGQHQAPAELERWHLAASRCAISPRVRPRWRSFRMRRRSLPGRHGGVVRDGGRVHGEHAPRRERPDERLPPSPMSARPDDPVSEAAATALYPTPWRESASRCSRTGPASTRRRAALPGLLAATLVRGVRRPAGAAPAARRDVRARCRAGSALRAGGR